MISTLESTQETDPGVSLGSIYYVSPFSYILFPEQQWERICCFFSCILSVGEMVDPLGDMLEFTLSSPTDTIIINFWMKKLRLR